MTRGLALGNLLAAILLVAPSAARALEAPDSSAARSSSVPHRLWMKKAEEGSPWREDRLRHASLSASLVLGATAAGANDAPAAAGAFAVGLVKEGLDARSGPGASRWDVLADVLGVGLGLWASRVVR